MRDIKIKNKKVKEVRATCHECKTVFIYNEKDVLADSRDGDYVICPNKYCKAFISSKI